MTGYWHDLSRDLHGKYKLFTDMYDNIDVFEIKLRLWGNQSKQHNSVHCPHLKAVNIMYPELFNNTPSSFFGFEKTSTNHWRTSELWNQNFCCFLKLEEQ